jgi:putative acetyltransferase
MRRALEGSRVIRSAETSDIDAIITIWLEASIQAHAFVPDTFWRAHAADMRDRYLPSAESYVDELDGKARGFASLVGDTLAALFVAPAYQGAGVGSDLLLKAQSLRSSLTVSVYAENERALKFYSRHGFVRTGRHVDDETGAQEVTMRWQSTF